MISWMHWPDWGNWLFTQFFPGECAICHDFVPLQQGICATCLGQLLRNDQACTRCANPLPNDCQRTEQLCGKCLTSPPFFDQALSPLVYQQPLDQLIHQFKYHHQLHLARPLIHAFCRYGNPLAHLGNRQRTILLPIPLHPRQICRRGFNQALELAQLLQQQLHLPLYPQLLLRQRDTVHQRALNARARKQNIQGAFVITPDDNNAATLIRENRIILVDDVMTTGSTLNEAARVLKRAGCEQIWVWTMARA